MQAFLAPNELLTGPRLEATLRIASQTRRWPQILVGIFALGNQEQQHHEISRYDPSSRARRRERLRARSDAQSGHRRSEPAVRSLLWKCKGQTAARAAGYEPAAIYYHRRCRLLRRISVHRLSQPDARSERL